MICSMLIGMERTMDFWLAGLTLCATMVLGSVMVWAMSSAFSRPAVVAAVAGTASSVYCLLRALVAPAKRPDEDRGPTVF